MRTSNPRKLRQERDMQRLFGDAVVCIANLTDPATLDLTEALMDRVHDAAERLLHLAGDPAEQQRYVSAMPFETRLVLCMWLIDTTMATRIIRAVYTKV